MRELSVRPLLCERKTLLRCKGKVRVCSSSSGSSSSSSTSSRACVPDVPRLALPLFIKVYILSPSFIRELETLH